MSLDSLLAGANLVNHEIHHSAEAAIEGPLHDRSGSVKRE